MPRRTLTVFTISFLNMMSYAFGAIILIYPAINYGAAITKLDFVGKDAGI